MTFLTVRALWCLLRVELLMSRSGTRQIPVVLKRMSQGKKEIGPYTPEQLCRAIDIACVLYWKQVLCLQRSAATAILLRHYGFDAELVIGATITPLRSHAWIEINRVVVNDKAYVSDMYKELERC